MKYKFILISVLLGSFLGFAYGTPYWDTATTPNATYQEWNFLENADFVNSSATIDADQVQNQFANGQPIQGQIVGYDYPGLDLPSWEAGVWSGEVFKFLVDVIPNSDVTHESSFKEVVVELAYRGSISIAQVKADGEGYSAYDSEIGTEIIEGIEWTIRKDYYHIEPNPTQEYVCYGFGSNGGPIQELDYLNVSTVCVPEPASMCLLLTGGVFLRKFRKRV